MKEYNLGPNGGIFTPLNIFATKIGQTINTLEKRTSPNSENLKAKPIERIIVDTPGQIEVFVWSASSSILLDSLASAEGDKGIFIYSFFFFLHSLHIQPQPEAFFVAFHSPYPPWEKTITVLQNSTCPGSDCRFSHPTSFLFWT